MAEVKNNFLQAKMNKDLDARLIPNGQYRDAQNIVISRSEGDSVGTVQNILGNVELSNFGLTDKHLEVIGYYVDELKDNIYFFITNYTDASENGLNNFAPSASKHYICSYNTNNNTSSILVNGNFLNFSKTSNITGVDMIENILFFTDNRNQPRRINVDTALSNASYYNSEDNISVLKYYPHSPILLTKEEVTSISISSAGSGYGSLTLPFEVPVSQVQGGTGEGLILTITSVGGPSSGITGIEITNPGVGYTNGDVINVYPRVGNGQVTLTVQQVSTMKNKTDQYLPPKATSGTNLNPDYDANWPGDKDYLKERFIRFSYRFKFEDDEYSLIAPFTQVAFVPENDGYFLSQAFNPDTGLYITNDSDEEYAYISTINRLMRNKIDEVGLILNCPSTSSSWAATIADLKIKEVEILIKEASQTSIKVLDTIESSELANVSINKLQYDYQSRKPIRTLSEVEYTRVSDKAPVRAFSLSCSGNRVIYSNYYDKHTSPDTLDYNVNPVDKTTSQSIEYQNHSLKQNRTYQVGVVLSDRYGRQSDVILSKVDDGVIPGLVDTFKGSTLYNNYRTPSDTNLNTSTASWNGEGVEVLWKTAIPSVINKPGYPGLYSSTNPLGWYSWKIAVKQQEQDYYNVYLPSILNAYPNDATKELNRTSHISLFSDNINKVPKDLTDVGPEAKEFRSSVNLFGRVTNTQNVTSGNAQFYPTITPDFVNTIGTQKDLNIGSSNVISQKSSQSLINGSATDTIVVEGNFRSDAVIGQRVSAKKDDGTILFNNKKLVSYIAVAGSNGEINAEIKFSPSYTNSTGSTVTFHEVSLNSSPFYNAENNPLIGRISTRSSNFNSSIAPNIGEPVDFNNSSASNDNSYFPLNLAVYETKPEFSNLEIFWETSTTGLISSLNTDITTGDSTTPYGYSDPGISWFENEGTSAFVTNNIFPVDFAGNNIVSADASFTLDSVTISPGGNPVNNLFDLINNNNGSFVIKTKNNPGVESIYFGQSEFLGFNQYTFTVTCVVNYRTVTASFTGGLSNIVPSWTFNTPPATTFDWGDQAVATGPEYNNMIYLGSLLTYGTLRTTSEFTGSTNGNPTNGSVISSSNSNQTRELSILNLSATFVSGDQQAFNGNIITGPALLDSGTTTPVLDPNDNSSTGLGIYIDPSAIGPPQDPGVGSTARYDINFKLYDGGGLFTEYTVRALLAN
jgi:hypothetical protein